jgi:pimeloyl-ACP methyl ester carboxylesterase
MQPGALAGWAAKLDQPSAVLGIDMPVHGSRRNGSTRDPQDLFFNFNNPQAARGNAIQGAADLMGMALLASKPISASASPTGAAIRFNADRVVLFAHSQGATHASLMIGGEPRIRAAVLSGIGGHISTSLREKQKPVNLSAVLPFVLFDPDTSGKIVVEAFNPMLALVQSYLDSADPLNFASQLALDPPSSTPDGHDLFMTYGRFDSFTPEDTQQFYAKAGGLPAVEQDLAVAFTEIHSPAIGNLMPGSKPRTVALRTYDPHEDAINPDMPPDGHFVATQTTRGLADTRRFMEGALRGETPQIGQ